MNHHDIWIFIGKADAEAEAPILWAPHSKSWLIRKDWRCWERLKAGEGDNRGWGGWMASPTRWTWVWAIFRSWWTGRPGVLQSMGSQTVGHDWGTELNWTDNHHDFRYVLRIQEKHWSNIWLNVSCGFLQIGFYIFLTSLWEPFCIFWWQ